MTRRPKPTMHGRDHAPDGPDPIPDLGGGLTVKGQTWTSFTGTSVAAGATTSLDFGSYTAGDTLVTFPTTGEGLIAETGVYLFICSVRVASLPDGKDFVVQVGLGPTTAINAGVSVGQPYTYAYCPFFAYGAVSNAFHVAVTNNDTAARDFYLAYPRLLQLGPL